MEDLKRIDYKEGMTHKDVRDAINANTERANANFEELSAGASAPYVVKVKCVKKQYDLPIFSVEIDRELAPGDTLQLMRYTKQKRKVVDKGDDVYYYHKKWSIARPKIVKDREYKHPRMWLDLQKCYFELTGGGNGEPYRYSWFTETDDEVVLEQIADGFIGVITNFEAETSYVKISNKKYTMEWSKETSVKGSGSRLGSTIPLGFAVVRSEIGAEFGEASPGRPYSVVSNIARFDITVNLREWAGGKNGNDNYDFPLDTGSISDGLGVRIY